MTLAIILVLAFGAFHVEQCAIPGMVIIESPDPCRTWAAVQKEYGEAEGRVSFHRWLMDLPFRPFLIADMTSFLIIREHPSAFTPIGTKYLAAGMFAPAESDWYIDTIEYAADEQFSGRLPVLRHELGHWRELIEERREGKTGITAIGYRHFGHGDSLDPLIIATNAVKNWFQQSLPWNHPYYVPDLGRPPQGNVVTTLCGVSP